MQSNQNISLSSYAQEFHACLARHGLHDWSIYSAEGFYFLHVAEKYLGELGCKGEQWNPLQDGAGTAFALSDLTRGEGIQLKAYPAGVLLLRSWHVAIARWFTFRERSSDIGPIVFCASRSLEDLQRFRNELHKHYREDEKPMWRVYGGNFQANFPRDTNLSWDALIMEPALRAILQLQAVEFFGETTRKLYGSLGLPYKRGILLWGPPGNGKTSIIRTIASMVPGASAFCLQPGAGFDDDELRRAIDAWHAESPSILVLEDIDSVLKRTTLSTLLNLLDGIGPRTDGGHLLIATTNHPDSLDPAISNRPGRFDVALELPSPTWHLREAYFCKYAPELDVEARVSLARKTEGLSFSHLREVLLAGGHNALRQERTVRTFDDLIAGATIVRSFSRIAETGFESTNSAKFGFNEKLVG